MKIGLQDQHSSVIARTVALARRIRRRARDFQQIGRTEWDSYNVASRDPVKLVDARLGIEGIATPPRGRFLWRYPSWLTWLNCPRACTTPPT